MSMSNGGIQPFALRLDQIANESEESGPMDDLGI